MSIHNSIFHLILAINKKKQLKGTSTLVDNQFIRVRKF